LAPVPAPTVPAPPSPALPPSEVRKLVTLVFTDLKDSTALTASIDAEAMNEIKARYFSAMAAEIERYGGKALMNRVGHAFFKRRMRETNAIFGGEVPWDVMASIVLIVAGVLGLAYGSFSFTKQTHDVKVGPIEMSVQDKQTVNVPAWAGVGAIVIGGALLLFGARKP